MTELMQTTMLPWLLVAVLSVVLVWVLKRPRKPSEQPHEDAQGVGSGPQFDRDALQVLTNLSADWLWRADAEHRLSLLSEGFDIATGTRAKKVLGRPPWELGWQAIPEEGWNAYRSAVRNQQIVHVRLRFNDDAGTLRFIEIRGRPASRSNPTAGYLGIGRDITQPMSAEQAAYDIRTLYQDMVNSVREVIFRADEQQRFTLLNQAWEVITKHPTASSMGRTLASFIHPDDRDKATKGLDKVLAGKQPAFRDSLRLYRRTGEICWIELTARRVIGDDSHRERCSLVGAIEDISSRKIAEMSLRNMNQELEARVRARTAELEISNRELEAFSYSVSHDLRAPLRSIDGFTRLIEEDLGERLDANTRQHLERIRNAAERMNCLSDKLLELARFTRHTLKKESVNLSEMAIQVCDELRAEHPERKAEIEITADLMAVADKTLMRVVLDNLLGNAWKFTADRELTRIRFTAKVDHGQRVFCISDNGVGFDMAFSANLFRPFYRLHDEKTFKGTGIGLANVQRIIERHGGRIWADSLPDQGANFHFTLSAQ